MGNPNFNNAFSWVNPKHQKTAASGEHPPLSSDLALSLVDLVLRRAATCPAAPALVDAATGRTLIFGALRSAVLAAAAALSSRVGVRRGDVVLLLAPNSFFYPVDFLVVTSLGAVATTANPLYTTREITKQAANARANLVVTVTDLLPKIAGRAMNASEGNSWGAVGRKGSLAPGSGRKKSAAARRSEAEMEGVGGQEGRDTGASTRLHPGAGWDVGA